MKKTLYGLLCAGVLLGAAGCSTKQDSVETAQSENESKNAAATTDTELGKVEEKKLDFDSEFLTKAASGGMLEVQLGDYVAKNGSTTEGKQFGSQMVADHTKANAELKSIAAAKNVTLPAALGDDHAKVYKDVTEEKGADLDKEYLKEMVKDHEEDVKEFTEASVKAADPTLKAFATKQVPVLQHHLEMAQQMYAAVKDRK
ncbi:DUF4142 domain-containing protein [Hymenobacter persicinus]|uniref:DUF4142 domain-containing protein n=1 Tax=Hymenobacter persicinus TaxID=2025506 RepID=A0A4Q5LBU8_9BACT|nr:DUF4142 domain-containing protein [Hymenobacter persicinus]RYU80077.1 DUF4142 domain-containing protein [Hymenobacter persicinus]